MNDVTHYVYFFYFVSNAVRDGLEYVTVRDEYSVEGYNAKKNTIVAALKEGTPFDLFCKNNGEKGEKVRTELKTFFETVYGDNSTFVKIIDGKVEVDHTQNSKVLRELIPLKVSLYNILKLHCNAPQQKDNIDKEFVDLFDEEEKFFECVASMIISDYAFRDRFIAFNKAKKDAQGGDTVESNFIQSELNDALGLWNLLKGQAEHTEHKEFIGLETYVGRGIDLITGKVKPEEGKKLEDEFNEIYAHHQQIVIQLEHKYKEKHLHCFNILKEFEEAKRNQEKN